MAVSGGMCTAYRCAILDDGHIHSTSTTYPRGLCDDPAAAVRKLADGGQPVVAGGDMEETRRLWGVFRIDIGKAKAGG